MKNTIKNAIEIESRGGAVQASSWVTGSGRYITKRPVPQFCQEIDARDVHTLKGKTKASALRIIKQSPRTQKLICLVDRQGLNSAKPKAEQQIDDYPAIAFATVKQMTALVQP